MLLKHVARHADGIAGTLDRPRQVQGFLDGAGVSAHLGASQALLGDSLQC